MHVIVMGMGCPKCAKLYGNILALVEAAGPEAAERIAVDKEEDLQRIMEAGVFATPGLVIDGQVVATGRIPSRDELKGMLGL